MAKPGVMLVNTSRGALVDVEAVVEGLKSGRIGYLAIDVYEQEADLFFQDLSNEIIQDDAFQRLLTFPNVLVTGHQAFFTQEAMTAIADTTLANITAFERGEPLGQRGGRRAGEAALTLQAGVAVEGVERDAVGQRLAVERGVAAQGQGHDPCLGQRRQTCTQRSRLSINQISRTEGSRM